MVDNNYLLEKEVTTQWKVPQFLLEQEVTMQESKVHTAGRTLW